MSSKSTDLLNNGGSITIGNYDEKDNLINIFVYKNRARLELLSIVERSSLLSILDKGHISYDQADVLLKEHERTELNIINLALDFGFINYETITQLNTLEGVVNFIDLLSEEIELRIIKRLTRDVVLQTRALAFGSKNNKLQIATDDPTNISGIDAIKSFFTEFSEIEIYQTTGSDLVQVVDTYLTNQDTIDKIIEEIYENNSLSDLEDSPIIKLVNVILQQAVSDNASDVHFEPESSFVRIRYRINGILKQVKTLDKSFWKNILVRIKVMANINIIDSRKPLDGKIDMVYLGRNIDFRVATQPTIHGENVVVRILDNKRNVFSLEKLGINVQNREKILKLTNKPYGLVLCTGPTGSGKTTTLYTMLSHLNSISKNIMTLEDPVEYNLPLIRQTSIKNSAGFSFDVGITALMRQSPDVILVGEVRDEATASAVMRAVMTGHQVFSTLHTIDAAGVIQRLVDLGVSPSLISGNLSGIISQRLVQKLCGFCKKPRQLTQKEITDLKLQLKADQSPIVYEPNGCEQCKYTGYQGRVAAIEVLEMTTEINEYILEQTSRQKIYNFAVSKGFIPLKIDLKRKVLSGITSLNEAQRVFNIYD